MVRAEKIEEVADKAELNAEERVLDLLLPPRPSAGYYPFDASGEDSSEAAADSAETARDDQLSKTREKLRAQLREGKLDNRLVELEVREKSFPTIEVAGPQGVEEMGINMKDMLGNLFQGRTKRQRMRVDEAMEYLMQEEEERSSTCSGARGLRASRSSASLPRRAGPAPAASPARPPSRARACSATSYPCRGHDVKRLRLVRTIISHAAAPSVSNPSDYPECRGGYPSRRHSLTLETQRSDRADALLNRTRRSGDEARAGFRTPSFRRPYAVASTQTSIGARRLHTIMEKVLDEISFEGPDLEPKQQLVDAAYVERTLADIVKNQDLSRYVL